MSKQILNPIKERNEIKLKAKKYKRIKKVITHERKANRQQMQENNDEIEEDLASGNRKNKSEKAQNLSYWK